MLLQICFCEDDILGFLHLVLQSMHNIPYDATKNICWFEDHPHVVIHMLLHILLSCGMIFDSGAKNQIGILDIVIVTRKYRHYLELKTETGDSVTKVFQQITDKHYSSTFLHTKDQQRLLAFYYGVKWTDKSTHATVEVVAEEVAANTDLWKNKLSLTEGQHIISAQ
jgi:hypothetical protein